MVLETQKFKRGTTIRAIYNLLGRFMVWLWKIPKTTHPMSLCFYFMQTCTPWFCYVYHTCVPIGISLSCLWRFFGELINEKYWSPYTRKIIYPNLEMKRASKEKPNLGKIREQHCLSKNKGTTFSIQKIFLLLQASTH